MIRPFLGALQFLTRVPVRLSDAPDPAATLPFFPLVGALVGAIGAAAFAGLDEVLPTGSAAAVAVLLTVAVTGAFHEDGLADSADALGGWTVDDRRRILKDSRHGSYGVAALTGSIVVRVVTLAALPGAVGAASLVASHATGRSVVVTVMSASGPGATGDDPGLGSHHLREMRRAPTLAGAAVGVAIVTATIGWWAAVALPLALLAGAGTAAFLRRAFGGLVGDALGAVEQVAEIVTLLVVAALTGSHGLWWST